LSGNLPETRAAATIGIGWIKLRAIETVEELCPELGTNPSIWTELSILKDRKVKIFHSIVPYVRLRA
jgi:hypothetical protein